MLPFGLTTDVSAGALVAGSGGALGAGQGSAGQGNSGLVHSGAMPGEPGVGFAQELKAVAGQAGAGDGSGTGAAIPADGAEEALQLLASRTGVPAHPVQPQDNLPGDVADGLPVAASSLQGSPVPDEATDPEAVGADTAGQEGLPGAEVTLAALAPLHIGAPSTSAAVSALGAGVPQAGLGLSGDSAAAGSVPPGTAPLAQAAAGVGGAEGPVAGTPLPASAQSAAGAATGAPSAVPAAPQQASAPEQAAPLPQQSAASTQQTAPAGRRWQTELPQEFRAPPTLPVQTRSAGSQTVETQLSAVATANAGGTPATGLSPSPATQVSVPVQPADVEAGLPRSGVSENLAAAQLGTTADAPGKAPLNTAPQSASPAATSSKADGPVSSAQGTVPPAAANTAAPAVAQASVQASVQAPITPVASGDVPPPAVPEALAALDAEGEAVPGKPVAADSSPASAAKSGATVGTAGTSLADARQGTAQNAGANASPAVAVAAVAPVLSEEAELPLTSFEAGSASEFSAATVRGGDMSGAMRTESLQTPNQAQSTHVATQVAAEIVRNLKNGQTQFQMRFDPPELGRVEVKMRVGADGSVQAHLIVDRPETLDMFLRDQRGLERALEAAGLSPDSNNLQFSLKQDGDRDMAGDRENRNGSGDAGDGASEGAAELDPDLGDRVRLMLAEQRGGLDMKV